MDTKTARILPSPTGNRWAEGLNLVFKKIPSLTSFNFEEAKHTTFFLSLACVCENILHSIFSEHSQSIIGTTEDSLGKVVRKLRYKSLYTYNACVLSLT
jgi:hypothetical protein